MSDAGGFDIRDRHPLEDYLLETFEIDRSALNRLALFLLAHVLIDTRLISVALLKAVSEGGGLSLTEIEGIADKFGKGTFGPHLDRVRTLIPSRCVEIAEKVNDTRNGLLHWRRERAFRSADYNGQDVTTETGFGPCMDDVLEFIQTVPFNMPQ